MSRRGVGAGTPLDAARGRALRVEVGLMTHPFHESPVWPGTEEIAAEARRIEEAGFDGILVPEAGGHDPFLPVLIAAQSTRRVTLRTGVAVAFPRSPMATAQVAWDLQRFSGGRFELGLGTQVKGHNERRYATPWTAPPGPRLREYLLCMKAIFESFQHPDPPRQFKGKHYQFTLMPRFFNPGPIDHPHVPVFIAAVNEYMARLAGELCDGIFPHPICTPCYLREVMLPAVEVGARRSGRSLSDVAVLASPMIVTGRDRAEVERKKPFVKQRLAFYASTRAYHRPVELHGRLDVGERLYRLSLEGKWEEMAELVDDRMLEEFATVAPCDELGPRLKERWGDLLSIVHLDLPPEIRADEVAVRRILEALR
jgi:probable F420-dependent oxidoreductase